MIIRVSVPPEVYARELKRLNNFLNGRHSHARPDPVADLFTRTAISSRARVAKR